MRLTMLAIMTFIVIIPCKGQESYRLISGTDLTSLIRSRELSLLCGLAVGGNWSVCASASLRLPESGWDEIYITHNDDLNEDIYETGIATDELIKAQISMQYWPSLPFKGPFLSFGAGSGQKRNLRIPVSAGYVCDIWKGLKLTVAYDIELLDTIRYGSRYGKGLCIGLGYEF